MLADAHNGIGRPDSCLARARAKDGRKREISSYTSACTLALLSTISWASEVSLKSPARSGGDSVVISHCAPATLDLPDIFPL
jgi:hypothetical protein